MTDDFHVDVKLAGFDPKVVWEITEDVQAASFASLTEMSLTGKSFRSSASHPTGGVFSADSLSDLRDVLAEHQARITMFDIWIVIDPVEKSSVHMIELRAWNIGNGDLNIRVQGLDRLPTIRSARLLSERIRSSQTMRRLAPGINPEVGDPVLTSRGDRTRSSAKARPTDRTKGRWAGFLAKVPGYVWFVVGSALAIVLGAWLTRLLGLA